MYANCDITSDKFSITKCFNQMRYVKNSPRIEWCENFSSSSSEDRWKPGGFFSLADCTNVAASSNRNREKPNLSSLSATIKHALRRVSPFFFTPLLALSRVPVQRRHTGNCRRPVWNSYIVAWFTCLSYQKQRTSSADVTPCHLVWRLLSHRVSLAYSFRLSLARILSAIARGLSWVSNYYAEWLPYRSDSELKRDHFKRISPQRNVITFHVSISLIRCTIVVRFGTTYHFMSRLAHTLRYTVLLEEQGALRKTVFNLQCNPLLPPLSLSHTHILSTQTRLLCFNSVFKSDLLAHLG